MPLIKSKSPKAFSKNVEAEMKSGKPQNQSLAIAYSVKRKAGKKMAEGGQPKPQPSEQNIKDAAMRKQKGLGIDEAMYQRSEAMRNQGKHKPGRYAEGGMADISAKSEKRPMPDNEYSDSDQMRRNKGNKAPGEDSWTDSPTIKQAQKPSLVRLSQPKIVGSDAFSVRNRSMHDEENDMIDRLSPTTDRTQPDQRDDEEDAKKQNSNPLDMAAQHNNGKQPYNKAIEDQYAQDMAEADMKKEQSYARGGPVMEPEDDDIEEMEREDEAHLMNEEDPSHDEGEDEAESLNEKDPDREGPESVDLYMKRMAEGGRAGGDMDSYDDDGHEDSIAAAIMAKRDRLHAEIDSGAYDEDKAARNKMASGGSVKSGSRDMDYADGGEILSHGSMDSDDSDQADLSRNADEDANEEDQSSFNALRKENYSESDGLDELDSPEDSGQHADSREEDEENKHDMISQIRSKMNARRQFKQR